MEEFVKLYVYNLSQSSHRSSNRSSSIPTAELPLAYHTSIVAFGKEFSFNNTIGITITPLLYVRDKPDNIHELGRTSKTLEDLSKFINENLKIKFQARNYDVLLLNCQEFCKRLCEFLGVKGLPNYITTVPRVARSSFGSETGLIVGTVAIGVVGAIAAIYFGIGFVEAMVLAITKIRR